MNHSLYIPPFSIVSKEQEMPEGVNKNSEVEEVLLLCISPDLAYQNTKRDD